jgi:hypothetical protein
MTAILVLATFVVWSGYRLRRSESLERQNRWQQALAISAILFVFDAARAIVAGIQAADCDIRTAISKSDSIVIR